MLVSTGLASLNAVVVQALIRLEGILLGRGWRTVSSFSAFHYIVNACIHHTHRCAHSHFSPFFSSSQATFSEFNAFNNLFFTSLGEVVTLLLWGVLTSFLCNRSSFTCSFWEVCPIRLNSLPMPGHGNTLVHRTQFNVIWVRNGHRLGNRGTESSVETSWQQRAIFSLCM